MIELSKKFVKLLQQVKRMEEKLEEKRKVLQKACPHDFPGGISFTDCRICGMSNYYYGQEHKL